MPGRELAFVTADDGVRLAVDVHTPTADDTSATVLRVTSSDEAGWYDDALIEAGFAVALLHRRGTGASAGTAPLDHGATVRGDLATVARWVAAQSWSSGAVGVLGHGPHATDALLMATVASESGVTAVVTINPTDDVYSDGEYFAGGALRGLDLLDEPLADVIRSVAPPPAEEWARGHTTSWDDEWRRRIEAHEPALIDRLRHPLPDDTWRAGSLRLGPDGDGYRRVACPVLVLGGWASGRRNTLARVIEHMPNWRVIAGPWGDGDPSTTGPGPCIDAAREIVRTFDQHLRGGPRAAQRRGQLFARRPAGGATDDAGGLLADDGVWFEADAWPMVQVKEEPRRTRADNDEVDEIAVDGDVGMHAWRSGSSQLPWGQPLDQLADNARSVTYDWMHRDEMIVVGLAELTMQVRSSTSFGYVSAKLCDIAPDGTSTLVARTMLDLSHRGVFPSDPFGAVGGALRTVVPGEWIDLRLQFDAATWTLCAGHRLRLAITGNDWPHCWPARPSILGVRRGSVRLVLWSATALPPARDTFAPGAGPDADEGSDVEWRYERDVLRPATTVRARTRAGDEFELGVDTGDSVEAWATARRVRSVARPGGDAATEVVLRLRSDEAMLTVDLQLTATLGGQPFATRSWREQFSLPLR